MRIGLLEDDLALSKALDQLFARAGHSSMAFTSGDALIGALREDPFDLLVVDWGVPGLSGIDVIAWVRQHLSPAPPILMLTGRSRDEDVVAALEAGADDFVFKSADPDVLLARISALLRRTKPTPVQPTKTPEGIIFDPFSRIIELDGRKVRVGAKEFSLAQYMFQHLGQSVARGQLLEAVWGRNPKVATRTLDTHISMVRRNLGLVPEMAGG